MNNMTTEDISASRLEELKERFEPLQHGIGNTTLFEIWNGELPNGNRLFAKAEFSNPTGSAYDRVYSKIFAADLEMLAREEPDYGIEVSSSNAGASFAWFCAKLGLPCQLILPNGVPDISLSYIRALNPKADVRFPEDQQPYMQGAVADLHKELEAAKRSNRTVYCPHHTRRRETVEAIAEIGTEAAQQLETDFGLPSFDQFVVARGNGVSVVGAARKLKEISPALKVTAFEPENSPIAYNAKFDAHKPFNSRPELYGTAGEGIDLPFIRNEKFGFGDTINDVVLLNDAQLAAAKKLRFRIGQSVGHLSLIGLSVAQELMQHVHNQNFLVLFYDRGEKRSHSKG